MFTTSYENRLHSMLSDMKEALDDSEGEIVKILIKGDKEFFIIINDMKKFLLECMCTFQWLRNYLTTSDKAKEEVFRLTKLRHSIVNKIDNYISSERNYSVNNFVLSLKTSIMNVDFNIIHVGNNLTYLDSLERIREASGKDIKEAILEKSVDKIKCIKYLDDISDEICRKYNLSSDSKGILYCTLSEEMRNHIKEDFHTTLIPFKKSNIMLLFQSWHDQYIESIDKSISSLQGVNDIFKSFREDSKYDDIKFSIDLDKLIVEKLSVFLMKECAVCIHNSKILTDDYKLIAIDEIDTILRCNDTSNSINKKIQEYLNSWIDHFKREDISISNHTVRYGIYSFCRMHLENLGSCGFDGIVSFECSEYSFKIKLAEKNRDGDLVEYLPFPKIDKIVKHIYKIAFDSVITSINKKREEHNKKIMENFVFSVSEEIQYNKAFTEREKLLCKYSGITVSIDDIPDGGHVLVRRDAAYVISRRGESLREIPYIQLSNILQHIQSPSMIQFNNGGFTDNIILCSKIVSDSTSKTDLEFLNEKLQSLGKMYSLGDDQYIYCGEGRLIEYIFNKDKDMFEKTDIQLLQKFSELEDNDINIYFFDGNKLGNKYSRNLLKDAVRIHDPQKNIGKYVNIVIANYMIDKASGSISLCKEKKNDFIVSFGCLWQFITDFELEYKRLSLGRNYLQETAKNQVTQFCIKVPKDTLIQDVTIISSKIQSAMKIFVPNTECNAYNKDLFMDNYRTHNINDNIIFTRDNKVISYVIKGSEVDRAVIMNVDFIFSIRSNGESGHYAYLPNSIKGFDLSSYKSKYVKSSCLTNFSQSIQTYDYQNDDNYVVLLPRASETSIIGFARCNKDIGTNEYFVLNSLEASSYINGLVENSEICVIACETFINEVVKCERFWNVFDVREGEEAESIDRVSNDSIGSIVSFNKNSCETPSYASSKDNEHAYIIGSPKADIYLDSRLSSDICDNSDLDSCSDDEELEVLGV